MQRIKLFFIWLILKQQHFNSCHLYNKNKSIKMLKCVSFNHFNIRAFYMHAFNSFQGNNKIPEISLENRV